MRMQRNNIICSLAFLAVWVSAPLARGDVKVGDTFPDMSQCKLEGNLPDKSQDKVILVDFWASWCGPCTQSFPVMEELQKTYGSRGLRIIAVNEDEKKSAMERFLNEHPVSFTVVRDAKQMLVEKADIGTMPASFILDKNGKILFAHNGFHGSETKKQYEHEIESLLGHDK